MYTPTYVRTYIAIMYSTAEKHTGVIHPGQYQELLLRYLQFFGHMTCSQGVVSSDHHHL